MKKTIHQKFAHLKIKYDGTINLYSPKNAISVIMECIAQKRKILGIDAFRVSENKIQPFMEYSCDYSNFEKDKIFQMAISHIEKYNDKGLVFEIVIENE